MPRFQGQGSPATWRPWPACRRGARRDHSVVDLAIAWVLSHPRSPSACEAKSPDQVDDHVRAAGWRPAPEERSEVSALID